MRKASTTGGKTPLETPPEVLGGDATSPTPPFLTLHDLEPGKLFELKHPITSEYGYKMARGMHWVQQKNIVGCSLHTIHLESGRPEALYPCPKKIPAVAVRNAGEAREALHAAQSKRPGAFATFGASIMLGTDPEVFAVGADDRVIPAFKYLGGKTEALAQPLQGNAYHKQAASVPYWDGFQAEWNSKPFMCIAHLTDTVQFGLASVLEAARKHDPAARLVGHSVMPVPAAELDAACESHVQLGCLPSENAYGHAGAAPGNGRQLPVRFAGFHIHFGGLPPKADLPRLVRMLDKLCGVMSVAALAGLEDPIRRRYYGLAGEYRTPTHGLEWRVLSSAVLWHPALVHLHFNMARCAVQLATAGLDRIWEGSDEEAAAVVNGLDVEGAKRLIGVNRALYLGCLQDTYFPVGTAGTAAEHTLDRIILPGFREAIELDMDANWCLSKKVDSAYANVPTPGGWRGHSGALNCQFQSFATNRLATLKKLDRAAVKAAPPAERL